jgi:hypothetical protein
MFSVVPCMAIRTEIRCMADKSVSADLFSGIVNPKTGALFNSIVVRSKLLAIPQSHARQRFYR